MASSPPYTNDEEQKFVQNVKLLGMIQSRLDNNNNNQSNSDQSQSVLTRHTVSALSQADHDPGPPHHFPILDSKTPDASPEKRLVKLNTFVWGRISWEADHMYAATYPENPSLETQQDARNYFRSKASMIPCQKVCAPAWREQLEQFPPDVSSRAALMTWLRERHNAVNAKLGGPQFSETDMLMKLAEQKNAVAAVIYYATKDDYQELSKTKVTLPRRINHELTKFVQDPNTLANILLAVSMAVVVLLLWLIFGP